MMIRRRLAWLLPLLLAAASLAAAGEAGGDDGPRAEFERRYDAWRRYIAQPEIAARSSIAPRVDNPAFQAIVDLGGPAVPLVLEKMEDNFFLVYALERMTGHRLSREEQRAAPSAQEQRAAWRRWWGEGRRELPERFAAAAAAWRRARGRGETDLGGEWSVLDPETRTVGDESRRTALGRAWDEMAACGRDALPWVLDLIRAGEHDLLPLFGELTGGLGVTAVGSLPERLDFTYAWWEANQGRWLLPDAPAPPPVSLAPLSLAPVTPPPVSPAPASSPSPSPETGGSGCGWLFLPAGLVLGLILGLLLARRK